MREAAKKIEGEHDFRHFCKMDVVNVHNFVRTIYSFDIAPAESGYHHTSPPPLSQFTPLTTS
jgi:tRNA pseudouridine38/39 synthase